jgi:hypothetical protein
MTNVFWIAGNILFDLATGRKSDVLMLVNSENDASVFSQVDAEAYVQFVRSRAPNVRWSVEPSRMPDRSGLYVIKGVQNA